MRVSLSCPLITLLASFILTFLSRSSFASDEILGCGGFVKSPHKLDFHQIEIKLFSKGGSLKLKTECAPTTGYYFIPLESKGDYVLKISPPEGWTFSPSEVVIPFDGVSDPCSLGHDINFDFKGFAVSGSVISSGFQEGPSGAEVTLSTQGLTLTTTTGEKGTFSFNSIPPGKYSITATHSSIKFDKGTHTFTISEGNVILVKELVVSGYELVGKVGSDGNPVEKVTLVLVTSDPAVLPPKGCSGGGEGLSLPGDVKGKILCVESSDASGTFKFGGLSPGTYLVVPVYKGTNIVYNVSPDRQQVTLTHASALLETPFEVQGFTVQGRVKGHPGAKIMVNGVLKATSGHDGTFSIANVKPGNYEFEVIADKFLFSKKQISIQPTTPIIPDFVPHAFQMCGSISVKSTSDLTLVFTPSGSSSSAIREKVLDPAFACIYLPEGTWTVSLESSPEQKYFIPEKSTLQVPSGSRFSFIQFSGSISGSVQCNLSSCDGVQLRLVNSRSGTLVQEQIVGAGGKFSFAGLESGDYRLKIDTNRFCWKVPTLENIALKNVNIANLLFTQTGFPLELHSSHSTKVKLTGKTAASAQLIQLEGGVTHSVCLTDTPSTYRITPQGCHTFAQAEYTFTPGTPVNMKAIKHSNSWTITSPGPIEDLKLTRDNGEPVTLTTQGGDISIQAQSKGNEVTYTITSHEEPGHTTSWNVFSYGFIFEPTTFTLDSLASCQTNLMRVLAKQSHVIKGTLSPPLEGVELRVELLGDPDATVFVTSDPSGAYIAGPFVHSSGFKVTPTLVGYTFKPLPSDPYSFSVFQLAKIQVLIESTNGVPVPGVLLSISGPNSYRQNRMTDEAGSMTFGELGPGGYYLKALLKEFQFQPSAINIELKEMEAKQIKLAAIRESFSMYGQLSSLSGELMPNLLVVAKGVGNCSEYGEEGSSDEVGNFRIWALKSYCTYHVSVAQKQEYASRVERTIPTSMDIKIGTDDIRNSTFVIITPVRRMDVSLRIHTNSEKSLDTLKATVYSVSSPDTPLHSTPFSGISYLILPPIPKDDTDYVITFESTLNKFQYNYALPADISFPANSAYAHFSANFDIHPASADQEIGKNSYIALALIIVVVGLIANFERVGAYGKELLETYGGGAFGKNRLKIKTK